MEVGDPGARIRVVILALWPRQNMHLLLRIGSSKVCGDKNDKMSKVCFGIFQWREKRDGGSKRSRLENSSVEEFVILFPTYVGI